MLCYFSLAKSIFCQVTTDPYIVEKIPLTGELSGISGRCIFQDSHGFMWFGTNQGAFRYDGIEFKQFRNNPDDSTSISNDRIQGIVGDRKGDLWMATGGGLNKYLTETGKIIRYSKNPGFPEEISHGSIQNIYGDFFGFIWIGTEKVLTKYTPDNESFHNFRMKNYEWRDPQITRGFNIFTNPEKYIWVKYGDRQLCKYNTDQGMADTVITCPSTVNDLLIDRRGRFWVTTMEGLYQFDPKQCLFTRVLNNPDDPNRLNNQMISAIQEDRNGNLWIRTLDGMYMYHSDLELMFRAEHNEIYQNSFEDNYLTAPIYEDRSGTIWYFTRDAICKCYPRQYHFNALAGPDQHNVKSLCEDHNRDILFGSESLYHFNTKNAFIREINYKVAGNDSYEQGIESMLYDKQNKILWLGSDNGFLYKILFPADSIQDIKSYGQLRYDQVGKNTSPVKKLVQDNEGRIWIHCSDRLPILFDPAEEHVWNLYSGGPGKEVLEADSRILYAYKNGALLVLGKKGLYRFTPPFDKISRAIIGPDSINFLLNIEIPGIQKLGKNIISSYMDTEHRLWLGTSGQGLLRIDGAGDPSAEGSSLHLKRYTTSDGLPNNSIHSLVEDHHDNLWIGTEFGLSRMNPATEVFTNYNKLHGLPSSGFRGKDAIRNINGMLFFGTRDGLVYFNPDNSRGNQEVPKVLITGFKIHNREITQEENPSMRKLIFLTDTLILESRQNHLSFEFAALNYIMPQNNQYKYMLEGVDRDWVYCGNRNFTIYSDLKPGTYNFRVTASNNDGLWNPKGTSLYFIIPRPWYQKTAALFLWGGILIMLILGFIRFRTRSLIIDKTRLEIEVDNRINEIQWMNEQIVEMEAMKTRFFNNISHEFRNLISLIKVPVECLKEEGRLSKKCSTKIETIRLNTNKMANLVNQLLDISRIDKGNLKLKLSRSNVSDFVHAIAVSYTSLAETRGIKYTYELSQSDCMELIDEDKVEKILNNLLSNAFKFTEEGGQVFLGLKRKSQENGIKEILEIKVVDTGSGIPEEEHEKIFDRFYQAESTLFSAGGGAGIGLALTYDLVKLMHGTIDLQSKCGKGSTFTVRIPLGTAHLDENEYSLIHRENIDYMLDKIPDSFPVSSCNSPGEPVKISGDIDEKPLILIVEDNNEIRSMLVENMAPDFRVAEAINGSAGLKIAFEKMPELVLTDLIMPGMDGIELCSRLKADLRTSHIPIIILTGKASKEERIEGLKTGADDYISKPFEINEIKMRIKNLVDLRRKLKEKFSISIFLDSHDMVTSSMDQKFLKNVKDLIETHMSNEAFNVSELCQELNISRSTLGRKLNALTGMSPVEFIRAIRLERAATLLKQQFGNVSQVAMEVGFSNPSYFTRMFRQSYEVAPSEFARNNHPSP